MRTAEPVARLGFELAGVRQAGTARDREEAVEGVCCHAAPIREAGRVVAAVSVCVSSTADARFGDRYDDVVRAAGIRISRRLTREQDDPVRHAAAG
ncbi:MAG: IclR family transcriptional regulator C-terminal domain-containing protein [Solirubrobacteraceae bacterium]